MKLKLAIAAAAALVAPAMMPAAAQSTGTYGSVGYAHFDFDGVELGGVQGRLGYAFTPNLAVEGEATLGVVDDDPNELDNEVGLFGVAKFPVTTNLELFGRAGVSRTEVNGFDDDGFAYGAGATLNLSSQDGIRGDFTRHDYDGGEFDVWSLGYVRKF